MDESYRLLIKDLKYHAQTLRTQATYARNSTRKKHGDSAFADRCHTLAEAHDQAANIYALMAEKVESNLRDAEGERAGD